MNNKQYQKTRDTPHANRCYGKPSRQRVMGNAGTKGLLLYLGSVWDRLWWCGIWTETCKKEARPRAFQKREFQHVPRACIASTLGNASTQPLGCGKCYETSEGLVVRTRSWSPLNWRDTYNCIRVFIQHFMVSSWTSFWSQRYLETELVWFL